MHDLMKIFEKLAETYGPLHWWPADTPFEVAVGAILTQNTNWKNVEMAIQNLKREIALTPAALAEITNEDLQQLIRPSGFFRQKAERLQLFCRYLQKHHCGSLEQMLLQPLETVREELLQLKGIGPETADSILLYAGELPSFVVDAYTRRLFERLGLLQGKESYAEVRKMFMEPLPVETELFNEYHALIVEHCKRFCRKRPLCADCILNMVCPKAGLKEGKD